MNPRRACTLNGFQDRRDKPLRQLSKIKSSDFSTTRNPSYSDFVCPQSWGFLLFLSALALSVVSEEKKWSTKGESNPHLENGNLRSCLSTIGALKMKRIVRISSPSPHALGEFGIMRWHRPMDLLPEFLVHPPVECTVTALAERIAPCRQLLAYRLPFEVRPTPLVLRGPLAR